MLDALKEVGLEFGLVILIGPPLVLYYIKAWEYINKWEWSKKIARMENKIIPALFLLLVYITPFIYVFLINLLISFL